MIHLLIDTTVLRSDPSRHKPGMQGIARFASAGKIQVHLSDISRREFLAARHRQIEDKFEETQRCIQSLLREQMPSQAKEKLGDMLQALDPIADTVLTRQTQQFSAWLEKANATVHAVQNSHGAQVMDAYFAGAPPFASAKNRNDIPDAFIWQVIDEVRTDIGPSTLHVVTNDGALHEQVANLSGTRTYKKLSAFTGAEPYQALLSATELENAERIFTRVQSTFGWHSADDEWLTKTLREEVKHSDISCSYRCGVNGPIDFDWIGGIEKLDFKDHQYLGDGVVIVRFVSFLDADISYPLSRPEYRALNPSIRQYIEFESADRVNARGYATEAVAVSLVGELFVPCDHERMRHPISDAEEVDSIIHGGEVELSGISDIELHFL